MVFFFFFKDNIESTIFETGVEDGTSTDNGAMSEEQIASCQVDGDIEKTAKSILDEHLRELDQAGVDHTINKVQECVDAWGEGCSSTDVLKMLKFAKIDPEVLKNDGQTRLEKINDVLSMISAHAEEVLKTTAEKDDELNQSMSNEKLACASDVEALTKKCEDDIKAIKDKLQNDIADREKTRDQNLNDLTSRKAVNETERAETLALKDAAIKYGDSLNSKISYLLEMLNPIQDDDTGGNQ